MEVLLVRLSHGTRHLGIHRQSDGMRPKQLRGPLGLPHSRAAGGAS